LFAILIGENRRVVAQIDPALFQATVTRAEGDVAGAQAALQLAKLSRRSQTVREENFVKPISSGNGKSVGGS
jgi:hypothetical protein